MADQDDPEAALTSAATLLAGMPRPGTNLGSEFAVECTFHDGPGTITGNTGCAEQLVQLVAKHACVSLTIRGIESDDDIWILRGVLHEVAKAIAAEGAIEETFVVTHGNKAVGKARFTVKPHSTRG